MVEPDVANETESANDAGFGSLPRSEAASTPTKRQDANVDRSMIFMDQFDSRQREAGGSQKGFVINTQRPGFIDESDSVKNGFVRTMEGKMTLFECRLQGCSLAKSTLASLCLPSFCFERHSCELSRKNVSGVNRAIRLLDPHLAAHAVRS